MKGHHWVRVSKEHHCLICDHPDWCLVSRDGTAAICARVQEGAMKQCGEAGYLHRLAKRPDTWRPEPRRVVVAPALADVSSLALEYHAAADREGHLDRLADELGLSPESLRRFRVGWCLRECCSTWPMSDATNRIIGITRRFPDGAKYIVPGHKAGLYLPDDLTVGPDATLVVCEGATDAVAGRDLGLQCIGRLSCTHGARLLVELVKARRPGLLVIIGDTDEPGRRGAQSLAAALLPYVPALKVIEPPAPHKDLRAWRKAGATRHDIERLIAGTEPRRLTVRGATA
jgi:hypothetical protein